MTSSKNEANSGMSEKLKESVKYTFRNHLVSMYLGVGSSDNSMTTDDQDINDFPWWLRKYIIDFAIADLIRPVSELSIQNELFQEIRDEGILRQEIDSLLESTARMRTDLEQIKVQLG